MPSNPELFYLTAADYRTQSTVQTLLQAKTNEEVESLVIEAMALIDAYIGSGWAPYDDEQEFVFPRTQDENAGETFIPRRVALATRMVADSMLERRHKGVLPHEVASWGGEGHSYTKHKRTQEAEIGFESFPPEVYPLLDPYRRVGGYFAVGEPC
ncbi:MAG TPA: hypothetical protein VGN57_19015 [Pirellulaceae bacterium]|jgi:hypothetical protein|nr:hypothetical protein [Pirellulaceae bacterium]